MKQTPLSNFSLRAVLLGITLGLFVSGFAYYNDQVVQNNFLIGTFLPVGVFGVVLLFVLVVNPLLAGLRPNLALRGGEIAVVTALGLAACAWPGSNLYRFSSGMLSMPGHLIHFNTSWQSNHLMSYVPGQSEELAQGHVTDWNRFAGIVARADLKTDSPEARMYRRMSSTEHGIFTRAAGAQTVTVNETLQMTRVLNRLLTLRDLSEVPNPGAATDLEVIHANRAWLVKAFPDLVLPPPRGKPVLVDARGREDTVLKPLLEGSPQGEPLSLRELPWEAWGPPVRLWGLVILSLGIATVCMSLIVHTQWSKNELLSYPIARFLTDTLQRTSERRFPDILYNKFFWLGFLFITTYHLYNGMAAWFPALPAFSNHIDISPLMVLFPNARQVPFAYGVFTPRIYFTVIAFTFFLDSRVSLSLGISNLAWVMFGSLLIANGIQIGGSLMGAENGNLIRFGAFIGITMMILYTGRRFYRDAVLASFGMRSKTQLPHYVPWAGRGMAAATALAIYALYAAGLSVFWAILFTLIILVFFLVMGRIVAETGALFLKPQWLPVGIITALFGFEMIGPTQYIVMAMASVLLAADPRETLMPFILNGLKLGESSTGENQRGMGRLGIALLLMVVASFFVAGAVTLRTQYNLGLSGDRFGNRGVPSMPFQFLDRNVSELAARGTLSEVVAGLPLRPSPEAGAVAWTLGGIAIVLLFAFARLRFTKWPFHPVIFLIWGTVPMARFSGSFLIGWMIKEAVVKTTGAKGFRKMKPLMVGVIAAELLAAIAWGIVALLYYHNTGLPPVNYLIVPS